MSEKFGWCFIGCGTLAKKVAAEILPSGRHKIVSVYGRSPDKCAAFAVEWGAKAFSTAEEAIGAEGVDAVYIVTTHPSHFAYAKLALAMGKSVLCEKPITVSYAQAKELIAFAERKKIYFAEAMWTWFSPVARRVKAWLDAGEFGTIREVKTDCLCDGRGYATRVTDPKEAGGALLDMAIYPVTYLYRLFGKPTDERCAAVLSDGIDWGEEIDLCFADGSVRRVSVSIRTPEGPMCITLRGDKATLCLPNFYYAGEAVLERENGESEYFSGRCDYLNEFDIVASEIREGLSESRYVPHRATLDVMEILDNCRRQTGLQYPFETDD